nr:Chain B, Chains: B,D,F [Homo sapiens]6TNQ_D Chain D, Chains: B,D,F [Homo sapiens]6TNQ_F Chain F, Chains: B,D,F [Homo sapiens]
TSPKFRSR